jgi:hypothetical protein
LPPPLRGRASLDEKFATFNRLVNHGYRLRCPPPEKTIKKSKSRFTDSETRKLSEDKSFNTKNTTRHVTFTLIFENVGLFRAST